MAFGDGKEVFAIKKLTSIEDLASESISNNLRWLDQQMAQQPPNSPARTHLLQLKQDALRQSEGKRTGTNLPSNDGVGTVIRGALPIFDTGMIAPLWLALVPGHFTRSTNNLLPVVWNPRPSTNVYVAMLPAEASFANNPLRLLAEAVYYFDDEARVSKDASSIAAIYSASEWTTDASVTFPSRFSFTAFSRGGTNNAVIRVSGTAESAEQPPLPLSQDLGVTNIAFVDDRFLADPSLQMPLSYRASNLLGEDAIRKTEHYRRAVKQRPAQLRTPTKWGLATVVIVMLILPVALFILHRFRVDKAQSETQKRKSKNK
jgi:hypothetical protein